MTVVFHSLFEGVDGATTATDDAGGHAMTFGGNAQIDTAQFKWGSSSVLMDGAGDFISMANDTDWNFTGEFTIAAWVRYASSPSGGSKRAVMAKGAGLFNESLAFTAGASNLFTGKVWATNTVARTANVTASPAFAADQWYFLVFERDASDALRIYRDGVMMFKQAVGGGYFVTTGLMYLGAVGTSHTNSLDGWIGEMYMNNGTALYADDAGHDVPTAPLGQVGGAGRLHLPTRFLKSF